MENPKLRQEQARRDDDEDPEYSSSGLCGCFRFKPVGGGRRGLGETTAAWVGEKARRARELSEVIAGPKWKNLVRKVGAYFHFKPNKTKNLRPYDPHSYALNFDSGLAADEHLRDHHHHEDNSPLLPSSS